MVSVTHGPLEEPNVLNQGFMTNPGFNRIEKWRNTGCPGLHTGCGWPEFDV